MTQTLSAPPTVATTDKSAVKQVITTALPAGELAMVCAHQIANGFLQYEIGFRTITRNASQHFEDCDWQSSQQDVTDREQLYDMSVDRTMAAFENAAGERALDPAFWQEVRQDFARLIEDLPDGGLRRSFFNAIFKHCFESDSLLPRCGFVPINYSELASKEIPNALRRYACQGATVATANELLQTLHVDAEWLNVHAAAIQLGNQIESQWQRRMTGSLQSIEILDAVFYRFTRAFVVGRLIGNEGTIPFALALTNPEGGMVIDSLMLGEAELSELLGRPNASFQVELEQATDAVSYLQLLTPRLQNRQLFAALGYRAE